MRLTLLYFFLSPLFIVSAQNVNEKIFSNALTSDYCFGAVELGKHLFFSVNSSGEYQGNPVASVLYKVNEDLMPEDSISLTNFDGSTFFKVDHIKAYSDSSFMVLGSRGVSNSPVTQSLLLEIDTNLMVLDTTYVNPISDTFFFAVDFAKIDSGLIVCGYLSPPGPSFEQPFYRVFGPEGDVLKSASTDTLGRILLYSAYAHANGIYLGVGLGPDPKFIKLSNATLEPVKFHRRWDSPGNIGWTTPGFFSFDTNPEKLFAYVAYKLQSFGLVQIDTNLNILAVDTFNTFPGSETTLDRGILDHRSEDEIYFATGEDPVWHASQLDSGLTRAMRLFRIDTSGSVIWSRLITDSTSYYMPTRTVAAKDGGAYFFSMKYDWSNSSGPYTALSIIRLDAAGNFIGLHEQRLAKVNNLSLYPNPASDYLIIEDSELRVYNSFFIYSMDGKKVAGGSLNAERRIQISQLEAGLHLIIIKDKEGTVRGTGKFLKK